MRLLVATILALVSYVGPSHAVDVTACEFVASGRAEVVPLAATLEDGRKVSLGGILSLPSGSGPHPVILVLPGGGGLVTPYCFAAIIERFLNWGYATLIVASSTAREIGGKQLSEYSFADQAIHARDAVHALAKMDKVDASLVAVWGFSRGGLVALELALLPEHRQTGFKSIVAAAPLCPSKFERPSVPLLVVIGENDESVSVQACRDLAARLRHEDGFEFLLLPGARHVFWQDPSAAERSERQMKAFLDKTLR